MTESKFSRRSTGASQVPGKMANPLDPDLPPWERQPEESQHAYAAFLVYRDMEERALPAVAKQVELSESSIRQWSARWSWGYRTYEWDKYLYRAAEQDMVRYRRSMNERQRNTARVVQSKVVEWLVNLDVSKMRPLEAARWFEVAVRAEREAAGAHLVVDDSVPVPDADQSDEEITFEQVMAGLDLSDDDLALALHRAVMAKTTRTVDESTQNGQPPTG